MKNHFKKIVGSVLSLCLIFGLASTASASDYTLGRSYTWSPYTSNNTVTPYTGSIRAYHEFFFDNAGADAVNSWLYFTMEQMCGFGTHLIGDAQYSNLPYAHFDYDDDDEDGYDEESEVVMGSGGTVNTSTYYYFTTWWNKDGAVNSGNVDFVAQRSAYNPFNGEYEALAYDLLTQLSYGSARSSNANAGTIVNEPSDMVISSTKIEHEQDGYSEFVDEKATKKIVTVQPSIETVSDVDSYAEMQEARLIEIKSDLAQMNGVNRTSEAAKATVTFNGAISVADFVEILKTSGAEFIDCELKLLDENGTWITANIRDLQSIDSMTEIASLENTVSEDAESAVTYCGITSARLSVDLFSDTIELLSDNEHVFFVDMMDEIIRQEYEDYEGTLKVRVFDMAWFLAEANAEL